jgi:hypothetical protein
MTKEYPEDFNEDFNEEIKKMKPEEIRLLNEVYLMFSSKFIEYRIKYFFRFHHFEILN